VLNSFGKEISRDELERINEEHKRRMREIINKGNSENNNKLRKLAENSLLNLIPETVLNSHNKKRGK